MRLFAVVFAVIAGLFLVAMLYLSPMIESGIERINAQALEVR